MQAVEYTAWSVFKIKHPQSWQRSWNPELEQGVKHLVIHLLLHVAAKGLGCRYIFAEQQFPAESL